MTAHLSASIDQLPATGTVMAPGRCVMPALVVAAVTTVRPRVAVPAVPVRAAVAIAAMTAVAAIVPVAAIATARCVVAPVAIAMNATVAAVRLRLSFGRCDAHADGGERHREGRQDPEYFLPHSPGT